MQNLLPRLIRDMIDLIGWSATAAFVRTFGGKRIYVPKEFSEVWSQAIVDAIGEEATAKLIAAFGGARIEVPMCRSAMRHERNLAIIADYTSGTSLNDLVDRYGIAYRQIAHVLKHTDTGVAPVSDQLEWGF